MKLYKAKFHPISSLTKIPDAQTIFGAICSILKNTQGEDALMEYLNSFEDNPKFVHSSMYIDGLLPMPKVGLISIEEKNRNVNELKPKQQLEYVTNLKKFKKIEYISLDVFKEYIINDDFKSLKQAILDNKLSIENGIISKNNNLFEMNKQLLTHNNKSTKDDEKKLFYDNNLYLSNKSNLCVYFKTDDVKYVENIFKYFPYFGIGNRISIGKNTFDLLEIEEINTIQYTLDKRLLLSKCIGNDGFVLNESSYAVDSIMYSGSNYYSSNKIGRFNQFVEGSYMKIDEKNEYYGKVIKTNNGKDIYHYGIGFIL